jgi:hypothetical protein
MGSVRRVTTTRAEKCRMSVSVARLSRQVSYTETVRSNRQRTRYRGVAVAAVGDGRDAVVGGWRCDGSGNPSSRTICVAMAKRVSSHALKRLQNLGDTLRLIEDLGALTPQRLTFYVAERLAREDKDGNGLHPFTWLGAEPL